MMSYESNLNGSSVQALHQTPDTPMFAIDAPETPAFVHMGSDSFISAADNIIVAAASLIPSD